MKLLNYTTAYFSAILLFALTLFTVIFYFQMLDEIYDSLDDGLENQKILVINKAKKDPTALLKKEFEDGYYTIHPTTFSEIEHAKDSYRDTLMYMLNEKDFEPVRLLETAFEQDGNYYKLKVITSMVEEDDLIEDLLYSILWLYLGLIFVILLLNNWILKRLWKPFYSLLANLKTFRIEEEQAFHFEKTKVEEFQLLNTQVEKLLQKSTESFRSQKQFIENASHELQTPLAISINQLELFLEKEELSEENLEKLASVLENLERMTRLNQALLLLSKIDNKQFVEEESVSINTIIEQIALDFSDYAEHRNIKIELTSKASIAIAMNKDLAVILFTNLIKNAVVHAKENSTINIFIEYQKVTITNEAKHKQLDKNKLFKRFYKVNTHKNSTGLGLPITKAIADKYDFELNYTYLSKHIFSLKFN
ncbi:HAMP domain-containing sensor histidine kinase [Mesonia sp.]|uniref:sensor histidine kinase n=1 Tax=Mesonia sp. TaxID=1960830 RepID=UPI001750F5F2|nr:HAMP domain-containing sensor histidine kinase [Mesonia sp.]HIB36716.1 HAMP domain-containing histidine kinase [Mesonia sp.]HIO27585.1 HAMP domain-containing histidine kinase [Flavobacteriaceae bacterium]